MQILNVLLIFVVQCLNFTDSCNNFAELKRRLIEDLKQNSNQRMRPVKNVSTKTRIDTYFNIYHIEEIV